MTVFRDKTLGIRYGDKGKHINLILLFIRSKSEKLQEVGCRDRSKKSVWRDPRNRRILPAFAKARRMSPTPGTRIAARIDFNGNRHRIHCEFRVYEWPGPDIKLRLITFKTDDVAGPKALCQQR